jgi:hypothetical protein
MTGFTHLLHTGLDAASMPGLIYATTVTMTTATAVFARKPTRRRDARAALAILLRRRPPDN